MSLKLLNDFRQIPKGEKDRSPFAQWNQPIPRDRQLTQRIVVVRPL
jgi:hypothetical protein